MLYKLFCSLNGENIIAIYMLYKWFCSFNGENIIATYIYISFHFNPQNGKMLFLSYLNISNTYQLFKYIPFEHSHDLWNWPDTNHRNSTLCMLMALYKSIFAHQLRWQTLFNTLRLRQNGCHVSDGILNAFSWMKTFEFHLRLDWNLFLRFELTIFQHWFR